MIESISLTDHNGDSVEFHDRAAGLRVSDVQGLPGTGFAGPRDSVKNRPSYHGATTRSRWLQAGLATISGVATSDDTRTAREALDALKPALFDALAVPRRLAWRFADGLELQAQARLADGLQVAHEAGGRVLRWQVSLRLDDPRGFSPSEQIVSGDPLSVSAGGKVHPYVYPYGFNSISGGGALVENVGLVSTPPTFRIYGACTGPVVRLMTTGEQVVLTGEVAASDFLEISVRERTVKLNGSAPRPGLVDAARTTWFEIPTGEHLIQFFSTAFDSVAHVETYLRAAYL